MSHRPKILFFSEAVTLAHVSRPLMLMETLDPDRYDLHFACAFRYESYFNLKRSTYWPMESISYDAFISSMSGDKSAYDDEQVESYLAEEDALIREIQPDLIVNDARYTLCISAPSAGVPLVNINNSYWSPFRKNKGFPIPAYKRSALFHMFPPALAERLLPFELVKRTFPILRPYYHWKFLAPFNRARLRRGFSPLRSIEAINTFGDWTLYCDVPALIPLNPLPATHRFLGPLLWSPPEAPPLPTMDRSKPILYISLGSSNDVPRCREIVADLAELDVQLLVATANRFSFPSSDRVHAAEFLPGVDASKAAALVVCSGGSTAAYQALSVGTPVLGLPSNTDQHLAMGGIERWGAGLSIRADQATPANVREAVKRILADPAFKQRAEALAQQFSGFDARKRFREFMDIILPSSGEGADPLLHLQTLPDRLRRRAERTPDQPAFWGLAARQRGEAPQTYGQVWDQVQKLAAALRERGLERGERVGFFAGVDPAWELLNLAVMLAGGVVVGLDLHDAPDRVRNAAQQSDIKAWVVQDEKVLADWPGLFEGARLVLLLNDPPTLPSRGQAIPYRRLLDRPALSPVPWPNPDDLATLIFTSGTTGEPKGVPYTHRQLTHAVRAIARAYRDLPEGFQSLCWLPLSNLFQRMVNLCAMERGAVITFVPHPNQLVESLPLVRPELLIGVPRFYEKLEAGIRNAVAAKPWGVQALFRWSLAVGAAYRTGQHGHNSLRFFLWPLYQTLDGLVLRVVRQRFGGRLRYLVSGAAALNPKTIQFFWGLGLSTLEAYGTSENAVPIALNRPGAFVFGTTGQPLGPNEVQIGPDREVLVKGPSLFTGYWNQPREDSLFQGTYFRTGDEGRWEHGGFLKLLGRLSEIIKTSTGRRLAPGPIEQHFKEVPFVDQAVVLGNGRKGPALLVTIDPSRLGLTETAEGGFSPALKEKVEKALMDQAARLPSLSQPLGILVLNRAFSVLRGEITSNLKIRRRAIEHHYGSVLDTLYEEAVAASGATVWFLSSSDTRMQEFATLPVLHRLKTSVILRWISLGSFFLRAGRAYAKYSWNLYRAPWNFKKFQFTLFETLIRLFRNTVGPLKGPLVKIGQTLSYVDLGLPPALQGLLRELQYKTQPLSAKMIRNIIRRSLGKDPRDLFLDWHDIPLASASISQIHLARLKDGRPVAVKVRYPGIERIVKSDLVAVKALLPLVSAMTGVRNVRENFEEAKRLLLGECDFRKELVFMKRFQTIFAGHPRIVIPAVYPEFCSKDVLTMEYVEGQSYAEFKATASPAEIDHAGEIIYEMLTVSSLRHCLFQADPHPGNYLFRNGQVCFLDFGFCKEWSKEFVSQWKRQTRAVINNDLAAFSDATEKLGMRLQEGRMNYEQMLRGFRNSVERFLLEDRPFRLTTEFVKEVNRDLQKHAFSAQGLFVSSEMLAQGRLFWGQNSLYADLGCNVNFHRIILSVLNEGEQP